MYTHHTFPNMFSFSVILQIYLEIKAFYKLFDVYVLANKATIVESTFCLPVRPSLCCKRSKHVLCLFKTIF